MAEAKKVTNFADYQTTERPYEVSLTFSDEAGRSMRELMTRLGTEDPNEVALRAIGLLVSASAQGKEILLRDPKSGVEEAVDI
jgi:hypothetical protein